jgi:thioredoxin-related protein
MTGNYLMQSYPARLGLMALFWLSSFVALSAAETKEVKWLTDLDEAKKVAQAEKKDILVDFTGSDWCGWCKRLKAEVFDQPEFAAATKKFVLVELDFPQKKKLPAGAKEKNEALAKQFNVSGFPTILLLDSQGELYAQTGYEEGGAVKYLASLDELRKQNTPEGKKALAEKVKQEALMEQMNQDLEKILEPLIVKKDEAGAEAALQKFIKEKDVKGDMRLRILAESRVGILINCRPGDHAAVIKMLDELLKDQTDSPAVKELKELRDRVVKVRDAETAQGKGK